MVIPPATPHAALFIVSVIIPSVGVNLSLLLAGICDRGSRRREFPGSFSCGCWEPVDSFLALTGEFLVDAVTCWGVNWQLGWCELAAGLSGLGQVSLGKEKG